MAHAREQKQKASESASSLNVAALVQYTNNLPGAIAVKPTVPLSPKVLTYSNPSDDLPFNMEIQPKRKSIFDNAISA